MPKGGKSYGSKGSKAKGGRIVTPNDKIKKVGGGKK